MPQVHVQRPANLEQIAALKALLARFFAQHKGPIARQVAAAYGRKVKKVAVNYIGADGQVYP